MARTSANAKKNEAKREAARRRDAEVSEKAAAALADPNVGARVAALVGAVTPRMLGYSVRNQALLMAQAEERGVALVDVDTFRGWQQRGRQVRRGEHGFRIVRPVSRALDEEEANSGEAIILAQDDAAQDEADIRIRFRTMVVFEISQTDGVEDFDGDTEQQSTPVPAEEAAAILFASLREQAERAGYLVTEHPSDQPQHVLPVEVDHEASTINLYGGGSEALALLAGALAEILTEQSREQKGRRAEADPVMTITVA